MKLITTYRQFLILGNIQEYRWLSGFLHVSTIQLVIPSVLFQFMYTVYQYWCTYFLASLVGPVHVIMC